MGGIHTPDTPGDGKKEHWQKGLKVLPIDHRLRIEGLPVGSGSSHLFLKMGAFIKKILARFGN